MNKKHDVFIDNKLRLAITNTCNLSCFYCHNEGQGFNCSNVFMGLEKISAIVNWINKNNIYVESVNLTGREPLLHKNLLDIVDMLTKITKEIRINTNGVLLSESLIDSLIAHKVYALKIGIDSIFAEQTKPNINTSFYDVDRILSMIDYASHRMRVVLNAVVTDFNYKQIEELIEFARKTSVKRMKILRLHDFDSRKLNNIVSISPEYKTNQHVRDWYYYYLDKYTSKAVKKIHHKEKGRTDIFLDDGFEIRFCDDLCTTGACGNMFSEITAQGELLICAKAEQTLPIDFTWNDNRIFKTIEYSKMKICNSVTNHYSEYCDTTKLFVYNQYPDNFRTLGGFDIPNGHTAHTIARSARVLFTTPAKTNYLLSQGFNTVIDLRRYDEVKQKPSGYNNGVFKYFNLPMLNSPYRIKSELPGRAQEYYDRLIDEKDNMRNIFQCIASAQGNVIFHCAGGKSRSGVLSALLLMFAGVCENDIVFDYCRTYKELYGEKIFKEKYPAGALDINKFCKIFNSRFGTVEEYFKFIGLSDETISELYHKIIDAE